MFKKYCQIYYNVFLMLHRKVPLADMLDCDIIVNKFKIQLHYCIQIQTNTLGKGMNILTHTAVG